MTKENALGYTLYDYYAAIHNVFELFECEKTIVGPKEETGFHSISFCFEAISFYASLNVNRDGQGGQILTTRISYLRYDINLVETRRSYDFDIPPDELARKINSIVQAYLQTDRELEVFLLKYNSTRRQRWLAEQSQKRKAENRLKFAPKKKE